MSRILLILACTASLTFLTRLLPIFLMKYLRIPAYVRRFLHLMPIAALGALIFPASLLLIPGHWIACLAGVAAATIVSWFFKGLLPPVIISVFITWLLLTVGA